MGGTPRVLIVDDGELDRVERILGQVGVHLERLRASKLRGQSVEKPHDLLIMSWHPTREPPALRDNAEGAEPVRVCMHSQDFLPLRERLRALGFDYLVQTALDDDSLRLFLLGQLYRGPEQRAGLRLPLGGQVGLRAGPATERVKLADLSGTACRVLAPRELALGSEVTVLLPQGLGGEAELDLPGVVARAEAAEMRGGRALWSTLIRFEGLGERARAQLDRILRGKQIGTRATPLRAGSRAAAGPAPSASPDPSAVEAGAAASGASAVERRGEQRSRYEGRVLLVGLEARDRAGLAQGRDLSVTGLRISGAPPVVPGSLLTLALYGDPRGEPVLVEATVVRASGDEVGLSMEGLSDAQRRGIETLLDGPTMVESLRGDGPGGRRIPARLVSQRG